MPITPPHPPKRPRTSRMPVRRSRSLGSQDKVNNNMYSRESSNFSQASTVGDRRIISSAGEMQRPKERIEVRRL